MGVSKVSAALAAGAALLLNGGFNTAPADAAAAAPQLSIVRAGAAVELILTSRNQLTPHVFFLPGARPRFVLDAPAPRLEVHAALAPGDPLAAGVRHAPRNGGARVVIDLKTEGVLARRSGGATAAGWRTIYDLTPRAGAGDAAIPALAAPEATVETAEAAPDAAAPAPEPGAGRLPRQRPGGRIVVIDAGHGGQDSGALSASGAKEKDMTLAAALTLRAILETRGYHVMMTRDRDVFVPLAERVRIAREAKAALFISLHADSSPSRSARGASIYTLSERGGARAKNLMGSQDWRIDLGGAPRSGKVEDILVDLTQRETTGRSAEFADTLARRLAPVAPLIDNTHRSANYFVLLAPDVPAVLLEMGFMTHPGDEARLAAPKAREAMMEAAAAAIDEQLAPPSERSYAEAGAQGASFAAAGAP